MQLKLYALFAITVICACSKIKSQSPMGASEEPLWISRVELSVDPTVSLNLVDPDVIVNFDMEDFIEPPASSNPQPFVILGREIPALDANAIEAKRAELTKLVGKDGAKVLMVRIDAHSSPGSETLSGDGKDRFLMPVSILAVFLAAVAPPGAQLKVELRSCHSGVCKVRDDGTLMPSTAELLVRKFSALGRTAVVEGGTGWMSNHGGVWGLPDGKDADRPVRKMLVTAKKDDLEFYSDGVRVSSEYQRLLGARAKAEIAADKAAKRVVVSEDPTIKEAAIRETLAMGAVVEDYNRKLKVLDDRSREIIAKAKTAERRWKTAFLPPLRQVPVEPSHLAQGAGGGDPLPSVKLTPKTTVLPPLRR